MNKPSKAEWFYLAASVAATVYLSWSQDSMDNKTGLTVLRFGIRACRWGRRRLFEVEQTLSAHMDNALDRW